MARVTVEDCLEHVENRFKLVLLASKRARQLSMGTEPLVEWENDKPTVVALREIEEGLVDEEMMEAALAQPAEEEMPFDEDDLAAALHAEISRELTQAAPEGQVASQQAESNSISSPFAASPFGSTPENSAPDNAAPAPQTEPPSMESLLAQELAATSNESAASDLAAENPFSAQPAETQTEPENTPTDSAPVREFGIPTPKPDVDGDQ